ncbi:MAG: HEAT repeat domain-containing protein [bacterium]
MNFLKPHAVFTASTIVFSIVFSLTSDVTSQQEATPLSPVEQKQYEQIQDRLKKHDELLRFSRHELYSSKDEKKRECDESTANILRPFYDSRQIPQLVATGGIEAVKNIVAGLLKNEDPIIRGHGALVLAILGDLGHKQDIAKLIVNMRDPPPKGFDMHSYYYDRGHAAIALGIMRAHEYAPRLAEILQDPRSSIRADAALGLGFMGAKDYANNIAKLLSDSNRDDVCRAAMMALVELDATEYAKEIADMLRSEGDINIPEMAFDSLVRLNAQNQSKALAAMLDHEYFKGKAAKTLALLEAKDYKKEIAMLINDQSPSVKCDALIALGILDAREYVKNVAEHLHDPADYVRPFAAVALLLMENKKPSRDYADEIRMILTNESLMPADGPGTVEYFERFVCLRPPVTLREKQLGLRAAEVWRGINQPDDPDRGDRREK